MPRHMSYFLTQRQIRERTKDVTRRDGWANLKHGELYWAVEKAQGLGKGGKIVRICLLRCVSNRPEPLSALVADPVYGAEEARREGFPELSGCEFAARFISHMGGDLDKVRNRIEFAYVDDPEVIRAAEGGR